MKVARPIEGRIRVGRSARAGTAGTAELAGPTAAGTVRPHHGDFIEIERLTKRFGATTAVHDMSLSIPEGQFVVLLGPSGCGKTTTMRCIVGLEKADRGRITVAGRVLFDAEQFVDVPPNRRDMGMVFQSYALWPHKSVFGNVAFPLQMKRVAKATVRERVQETLALVGLDGFGPRSVSTLSGGQMQRVALARSLVMSPKILLLDEPLSNLDTKLRVHLRHELKEIQQRVGVTTIYVTHDQDEALGLADRIIVLRDGVVAQDGAPEALYSEPVSPFVADFLGMGNQYPATVEPAGGADGLLLATLDGSGCRLLARGRSSPDARHGVVCIRAESASVQPGRRAGAAGTTNEVPGEVLSRQYQGSQLRYHVALDGGHDLFAECHASAPRLEPGDGCTVVVAAAQVLVLPADGPGPGGVGSAAEDDVRPTDVRATP
jgi:iron(III) transport system ATP-binding protein